MPTKNVKFDNEHDFGFHGYHFGGRNGLPRYQNMVICQMEKLEVQTTPTMMANVSIESTDHPQSKAQGKGLKFCLWGE